MEPTTYLVNVADGLPLKTTAPDEGMLLMMYKVERRGRNTWKEGVCRFKGFFDKVCSPEILSENPDYVNKQTKNNTKKQIWKCCFKPVTWI